MKSDSPDLPHSTASPPQAAADSEARKRTVRACGRCRAKKVKCCGNSPCTRCRLDDAVCHFSAQASTDGKPIPPARAIQLQLQRDILIKALRVMWKRESDRGASFSFATDEEPSIHSIVESTGVLAASVYPTQDIDMNTVFDDLTFPDSALPEITQDPASMEHKLESSPTLTIPQSSYDLDEAMLQSPTSSNHPSFNLDPDQFSPDIFPDESNISTTQQAFTGGIAARRGLTQPFYCPMPRKFVAQSAESAECDLSEQHVDANSFPDQIAYASKQAKSYNLPANNLAADNMDLVEDLMHLDPDIRLHFEARRTLNMPPVLSESRAIIPQHGLQIC